MKNDRHATVEVNCETCGQRFVARKERVNKGLGRFCSKNCFDVDQRERNKFSWGRKDLAKTYKVGGRYAVRWYDDSGKVCSESYARWWWEMNVGDIPDKAIVLFKDNNPLNIEPSNFYLGTKSDALVKGNATRKKDAKGWADYKNKLSKRTSASWKAGRYEKSSGENHYKWRSWASKIEYPKEFYEIRDFIRERDRYICQICGRRINNTKYSCVHHIDGNKNHNEQGNLILFCSTCHNKVHSTTQESPPIMAFRSRLEWNK